MERHRALRPEQAEEADAQARRRARTGIEAFQRRRRERELGVLAEAQRLLAGLRAKPMRGCSGRSDST
jgi:hypothetical protein